MADRTYYITVPVTFRVRADSREMAMEGAIQCVPRHTDAMTVGARGYWSARFDSAGKPRVLAQKPRKERKRG